MSYDEQLVGSVAIIIACIAALISAGPWEAPYQLRTIGIITDRWGKPAARSIWLAIALASLAAGIAIFSGTRPSYVEPPQQTSLDR
ncbi:hypothetical protein [Planctomycetes bacterium K23_9]|uniref:hypothetical protein n=1 Tax=Stieleria marina TaxID=1930275 RepID=UPI0011A1A185